MDANLRRRSRVTARLAADFTLPDGRVVPLHTRNISLKGLLADPAPGVETGETGLLRLALTSDAVIQIECLVVRCNATGVALDFQPMDEDSFFHLRNLVRFNAPDADQIDAELKLPAFD